MSLARTGLILAGGASSRFGSDKALALIAGRPAILHLCDVVAQAGLAPVIVSRNARDLGIPELVEPPHAVPHPLYGIAALLGPEDVFVTPCDATSLTVEIVRQLVAARAICAHTPLCGVWTGAMRQAAYAAAEAGQSVRSLTQGRPTLDLDVGNRNRPASPL